MSHKANNAYIRMALGLPFQYTLEMCWYGYYETFAMTSDVCDCNKTKVAAVDYVWTGDTLVDEICKAWGITRQRFVQSFAAPKPSRIAHMIFNDELKKYCGETLPDWPRGRGLIIPQRRGRYIETIRFYPLHEILKPRHRQLVLRSVGDA